MNTYKYLIIIFIFSLIVFFYLLKNDNKTKEKFNKVDYDFVEIGTSNFDTLLEKADDNTKGISVEPLKEYLDDLPNKKGVIKSNYAISDVNKDETMKIYYLPQKIIKEKQLESWLKGCNSINKYHRGHKGLEQYVKIANVPVISIEKLYKLYNIGSIGYLKIDTEGHDPIILKSLYKFLKGKNIHYYPKKIQFESNSLVNSKIIDDIIKLLENINYKLKSRGHDTTMILNI